MAEDGKKVECIDGLERLRKAVDEINKGLDHGGVWCLGPLDKVTGKVKLSPPFTPRHSGRYPWDGIRRGKSREEIYDTVRNRKGLPSPGFIFANKDAIKYNTCVNYNLEDDTREYTFFDSQVKIRKTVPRLEEHEYDLVLGDQEAYTNHIISELAHEYDNIMIRKVLNMDSIRFNRFVSMLSAAGGNFKYDTAIGEESMATIQIPASMLYHLHIDGDGSLKEPSKRIPCIIGIQVFNDRAVQITFADGSKTKCVCGEDETFDLYEGIAFCLFKRFLGKDTGHKHFNDLMRYAFKKLDEQEEAKKRKAEIEAESKRHEEKKKLQAERRKARKREEKIGIFVEALKRNRQALINEMPVYSVPEPDVKFNKDPEEKQE